MIYRIKKGNHRASGIHFPKFYCGKNSIRFSFTLYKYCLYSFSEINDKERDWNKLAGLSFGYHMKNSVRISWRPNEHGTMFELGLYVHHRGNTFHLPLQKDKKDFKIFPNTICWGECGIKNNSPYATVEDNRLYEGSNFLNVKIKEKWGYVLNPYFGGNAPAPHTMNIKINELD